MSVLSWFYRIFFLYLKNVVLLKSIVVISTRFLDLPIVSQNVSPKEIICTILSYTFSAFAEVSSLPINLHAAWVSLWKSYLIVALNFYHLHIVTMSVRKCLVSMASAIGWPLRLLLDLFWLLLFCPPLASSPRVRQEVSGPTHQCSGSEDLEETTDRHPAAEQLPTILAYRSGIFSLLFEQKDL